MSPQKATLEGVGQGPSAAALRKLCSAVKVASRSEELMGGHRKASLRSAMALLAAVALGCGARSALDDIPQQDGGPPVDDGAPPDVRDVGPPDAGGLTVDCGEPERYVAPRNPLLLEVTDASDVEIVSRRWSLLSVPGGAVASVTPMSGSGALLLQDQVGDYVVEYAASDAAGRSASCTITVHSVTGPPIALCPDALETMVNEYVEVAGDGFDDDGIITFRWTLVDGPADALVELTDPNAPVTEFRSNVAATYSLRLRVTDIDGATDTCRVTVRVLAPPLLMCPSETIETPTREPLRLNIPVEDEGSIVRVRWEVISRPDGSRAEPLPPNRRNTQFIPDRQGLYILRFTATDDDGLSSSCDIEILGTPTPPDALCPDSIDTTPLTEVVLSGDGVDDGFIVGYRWRLLSTPEGSAVIGTSNPNAQVTRFTPDIAGTYEFELTVIDDDGQRGTCTFVVRALVTEGLRVEMFWNTDATDMDTHLLHPDASNWFEDDDCFYGNCDSSAGDVLEWFDVGPEDNPRLDIDDTTGEGPENINIDEPKAGTYRVGIHAFFGDAAVTVRIYCGGSETEPRDTFGPVNLRGPFGSFRNDFWRVADVDIRADGTCRITSLETPAGTPNLSTATDAQIRR